MKNWLSHLILSAALIFFMGLALYDSPAYQRGLALIATNNNPVSLMTIFLIFISAAISSWFISFLVIRYEHLHAHLSHDHIDAGPQKFNAEPTPRIGGLALFGGVLISAWVTPVLTSEPFQFANYFSAFFLAATPAFFGGIVEDITKGVGVLQRLLLTMISAAIGAWLLGAVIPRLDIPILDHVMLWLPFAIALTVIAVGGVANSINIIDGYNGLAAGFCMIALSAMAVVAAQVNDNLIVMMSISMLGALLGFLVWNWPKGKIFMGDGGAYLLGFILAELSVLLIHRNPSVSPWFPLVLLGYPVFETLFSMFRRKFLHQTVSGHPDAQHLHQLFFKWIVRHHIRGGHAYINTSNNSRVAPYVWLPTIIVALFAVQFWQNTAILMLGFLLGCILYVLLYWKLATLRLHDQQLQRRLKAITASFHDK